MKNQALHTVLAACVAQFMWGATPVLAQEEPGKELKFRYTAYFVCGAPEPGSGGQLVPGKYATQINMANWHGKELKLRKKVAFTYPPRMQAYGVHSEWIGPEIIERNHALSVDCEEIVGTKANPSEFTYEEDGPPVLEDGSDPTFYTGYLIIQSQRALNVTTVQTAGPRRGKGDSNDDDGDDKKKQRRGPQLQTISVTNVPERLRAEFQQHGDEAAP